MKQAMKQLLIGSVILSAAVVQAEVININFTAGGRGSSVGTEYYMNGTSASMPTNYSGTTWNDSVWGAASQTAMTDLLDTDGNSTTVDFALSGGGNYGGDSIGLDVLQEYRYFSGNASTAGIYITLTGLGAGGEWDVYMLSQGNANQRTTQFRQLDTVSSNAVSTLTAYAEDQTATTWTEGGNYVKFTITADETGTALFDASSLSGNNSGSLNGMQLVAVPEPATLGMVALFGGAVLFIRRRFMI